ncbi:MAG: hypothetical protein K9H64_17365 [Bacteroidales bacterium]|nr:hypothetical protein [Bacteroidales bacterium]MCF8457729.1 hypothetical protein [Bacteroidales bacterium]
MIHKPTYHYSNGKLLITGEYLILKGALSLAMPVRYGQSMEMLEHNDGHVLLWETQMLDNNWFDAKINLSDWTVLETNKEDIAVSLIKILKAAQQINPSFKEKLTGKKITTKIDFDINWGLGSSSSLLSNIAWLADIDPFEHHFAISNGSGYDVACARSQSPILFKLEDSKPLVEEVDFDPEYQDSIYFLYLGKKQESSKSVRDFLQKKEDFASEISAVSEISKEILNAGNLKGFNYLVQEHESILSSVLNKRTIKDEFFSSFDGEIKSLGAWGGDFALVSSHLDRERILQYFGKKGLKTLINFNEINILKEAKV